MCVLLRTVIKECLLKFNVFKVRSLKVKSLYYKKSVRQLFTRAKLCKEYLGSWCKSKSIKNFVHQLSCRIHDPLKCKPSVQNIC